MVVAATHQPLELGPVRELVLAAPRAGTGEAQPVEDWQW